MKKNLKVEKICYACGLALDDYPYYLDSWPITNDEVICPCCGIHYGYDDGGAGFIIPDELAYSDWRFGDDNHKKIMKFWRQHWIDGGMKWWSTDNPFHSQSKDWNPITQLENIPEDFK